METLAFILMAFLCGALIGIAPAIGPMIDLWLSSREYQRLHGNEPPIVLTERQKLMQDPRWSNAINGLVTDAA